MRIRVKTKSSDFSIWQWVAKPDGAIFRGLSATSDFTVLVNLTEETRDLEFFVVPTTVLDDWMKHDHKRWLERPGKRGQPHSKTNRKRHVDQKKRAELLEPYRDNWQSLWRGKAVG